LEISKINSPKNIFSEHIYSQTYLFLLLNNSAKKLSKNDQKMTKINKNIDKNSGKIEKIDKIGLNFYFLKN
tara:strand:- start:10 stop:222 length:213 start_codon:yes stop_codon:yes gene_type:complete